MLAVSLSTTAARAIKKLDPTRQRQVAQRIAELRNDPVTGSIKLVGYDIRRAKAGKGDVEMRILYNHDAETLEVLMVGSRDGDDIYNWLKRNYKPG